MNKRFLIGIDDTDNKDSRGTGYNSRQLATYLENSGIAKVSGITRHQLFVHPDIPYTSQNSAACLDVVIKDVELLIEKTRYFMRNVGAEGSDVGLCIISYDNIGDEIINWGLDAKTKVLTLKNAKKLAEELNVYLEGLTGTHDGMIGALASVGLRKSGNDGRFIWLFGSKNVRDIENGVHNVDFLTSETGIDLVVNENRVVSNPEDKVFLNNWARPILKDNKAVLLVENEKNNYNYDWKCAAKSIVREASN